MLASTGTTKQSWMRSPLANRGFNPEENEMDDETKNRAIFKGKLLLVGMAIALVYALVQMFR